MIPLSHHRRLASRKAWSEASYQESSNLHSWVILPTHGPLQRAIFFVVNAKHVRGVHAAHGRARRRMVALPPRARVLLFYLRILLGIFITFEGTFVLFNCFNNNNNNNNKIILIKIIPSNVRVKIIMIHRPWDRRSGVPGA